MGKKNIEKQRKINKIKNKNYIIKIGFSAIAFHNTLIYCIKLNKFIYYIRRFVYVL